MLLIDVTSSMGPIPGADEGKIPLNVHYLTPRFIYFSIHSDMNNYNELCKLGNGPVQDLFL